MRAPNPDAPLYDPRPQTPPVESDEHSQRCEHQREHGRPYDPTCDECKIEEVCKRYAAHGLLDSWLLPDGAAFVDWRGVAEAVEARTGDEWDRVHALMVLAPTLALAIADMPEPSPTEDRAAYEAALAAVGVAINDYLLAMARCRTAERVPR